MAAAFTEHREQLLNKNSMVSVTVKHLLLHQNKLIIMKKKYLAVALTLVLASASIAQPPTPHKPPSQEERLKHVSKRLDKELQLNADQKKNVLDVYKDFFSAREKVKADNPPPPPLPSKWPETAYILSGLTFPVLST